MPEYSSFIRLLFPDAFSNIHPLQGEEHAGGVASAPDLLGGLNNEAELVELLLAGEIVALDRRRESALGGEAELVYVHEAARLLGLTPCSGWRSTISQWKQPVAPEAMAETTSPGRSAWRSLLIPEPFVGYKVVSGGFE